MKKNIFIFRAIVSLFVLFSACSVWANDEDESGKNGGSVTFAENLGIGWNLGNTLDAHSGTSQGIESESSWGMPKTTKEMIHFIKNEGFSTLRLPVTWHNHQDKNFKIDREWLNRVEEITKWALEEDLFVIINIHHDNLTEADVKSGKIGYCLSLDAGLQTKSIDYLEATWKQIAERFKDYDSRLVFELLNEPRLVGDSREWGNGFYQNPSSSKVWNDLVTFYEQKCLDVIRKSGGKNSDRYILCPEYVASPQFLDWYKLPKDSAKNRLILSTHAYDPYEFCMGKDSDKSFTSSHEASHTYLFNTLSSKYTKRGIGVVMGETSASDKNNTQERIKWAKSYFSKAKKAKVSVIFWDNGVTSESRNSDAGERHGYLNRNEISWYYPEIIEAAKNAYENR